MLPDRQNPHYFDFFLDSKCLSMGAFSSTAKRSPDSTYRRSAGNSELSCSKRIVWGTIYDTICVGGGLPLDRAWEAARLAGVADEIQAMPMGMHTILTGGIRRCPAASGNG